MAYIGEKFVKHCFASSKPCSFYIWSEPSSVLAPAIVKLRGHERKTLQMLWSYHYGSKPEEQSEMCRGAQTHSGAARWRWSTGTNGWRKRLVPCASHRIVEECDMICSHRFFSGYWWFFQDLDSFLKNGNRCLKHIILRYKSKWRIKHTQDTIRFKSVPN